MRPSPWSGRNSRPSRKSSYNVILDTYAKARVSLHQMMGTTLEAEHLTIDNLLAGK
jgi:hypothetical protein